MKKQISFENRKFTKVKNPKKQFLCALCKAPREMRYSKHLSERNYLQMIIISLCLMAVLFPLMRFNAAFIIFVVWPAFELVNKFLYRKEIPCPYCGFDATWYRRDVRIARKKVEEFWNSFPPPDNMANDTEKNDQPTAH